MNLNRILKPISAILLITGMLVAGISEPADGGTIGKPSSHARYDTGWG